MPTTTDYNDSGVATNGQTLSVPFRPIQPLYTQDVTIPGQQARDAWITSLTVNDQLNLGTGSTTHVLSR